MLALIICKDLIKKPKQTHKILKTTTKKALPHILDRKDPLNLPQYSYQKKKIYHEITKHCRTIKYFGLMGLGLKEAEGRSRHEGGFPSSL